jgi:hypothetical protein
LTAQLIWIPYGSEINKIKVHWNSTSDDRKKKYVKNFGWDSSLKMTIWKSEKTTTVLV